MNATRERQNERPTAPLTIEVVQEIQQAIHDSEFTPAEAARFIGQWLIAYVAPECRCHPHGEPPYGTQGQVDCPIHGQPAPTHQPGSVAIATVRGRTALGVRLSDGLWAFPETEHRAWTTESDDQVTVTSRAVVISEADRDDLISAVAIEHGWANWYAKKIREWYAAKLGGERS